MVKFEELKKIHLEYIDWLEVKKKDFIIEEYLKYVKSELVVYDRYLKTNEISIINTEIPRAICRYLDEFQVDFDFWKGAQIYFDRMEKCIANSQS